MEITVVVGGIYNSKVWKKSARTRRHHGCAAQVGQAYSGGSSRHSCRDPGGRPGSGQQHEGGDGWCVGSQLIRILPNISLSRRKGLNRRYSSIPCCHARGDRKYTQNGSFVFFFSSVKCFTPN